MTTSVAVIGDRFMKPEMFVAAVGALVAVMFTGGVGLEVARTASSRSAETARRPAPPDRNNRSRGHKTTPGIIMHMIIPVKE